MHLMNILNQFQASQEEKEVLTSKFQNETVSFSAEIGAALTKARDGDKQVKLIPLSGWEKEAKRHYQVAKNIIWRENFEQTRELLI